MTLQGGPEYIRAQVGRVTVQAVPRQFDLALSLAELADRQVQFPGLPPERGAPIHLVVVPDAAAMTRLSGGRAHAWTMGLALPGPRLVLVRADAPDAAEVLRHELAHLALRAAIRSRVPLWFDEGYAVVAAGEWDRVRALSVNLAVVRGGVGTFRQVETGLRRGPGEADAAYALAATAVLHLARLHPERTLAPLLTRLGAGIPFDSAVVLTTGLRPELFERAWARDVRRRYGWVLYLVAGGGWALIAIGVLWAGWLRRRRDAPRRAALDEGWNVPPEEAGEALDPEATSK